MNETKWVPEDERRPLPAVVDRNSTAGRIESRKSSIFLGNLPNNISPEKIKEFVESKTGINNVIAVRLGLDEEKKCKGYGFIDFKDESTATKAIELLKGLEVGGRKIRVDSAVQKILPQKSNDSIDSKPINKSPRNNKNYDNNNNANPRRTKRYETDPKLKSDLTNTHKDYIKKDYIPKQTITENKINTNKPTNTVESVQTNDKSKTNNHSDDWVDDILK